MNFYKSSNVCYINVNNINYIYIAGQKTTPNKFMVLASFNKSALLEMKDDIVLVCDLKDYEEAQTWMKGFINDYCI